MNVFSGRNKKNINNGRKFHEPEASMEYRQNDGGKEGKLSTVGKFKPYIMWATFGFSGAHHFLLGRDIHAFLWLSTFGGFGIGLLRDLWRLKEYINDANEEATYMKKLRETAEKHDRYWSVSTFLGQASISLAYFFIFQNFPSEVDDKMTKHFFKPLFDWDLCYVCGMIGQALGIYLAGSTGRIRSNFKLVLFAVFLGSAIEGKQNASTLGFVFGIVVFRYFSSWNWEPRHLHRRRKVWRLFKLFLFTTIFWLATIRGTYHNVSINIRDSTTHESKKIKISEIVEKALDSVIFLELKKRVIAVLPLLLANWWQPQSWWSILLNFETGEVQAYNELNMHGCLLGNKGCDYGEVKRNYYELSREYHPDKVGTDVKRKLETEDKMMKINSAYEVLTKLHKKSKE